MVAYDGDMLLGYTWARRGERAAWSTEEMVSIRMAHVRLDLSDRERITLVGTDDTDVGTMGSSLSN
jgi:hypothetical protein